MKTIFRGKAKLGLETNSPPYVAPITQKFTYDFARDGGAVSAIAMKDSLGRAAKLPDNAVVLSVRQESITDCTSSGAATVALGITGTADKFLVATAYTDASFDVDAVTARNASVPYKAAASDQVLVTIATAALTAGKFNLYIDYFEGD